MGPQSPIFPVPVPEFRGRGGDGDKVWKNFGDFFGDEGRLNFEFFWGFIPESPQNIFGEILGTGISLTLGIFEFFSPKKTQILGNPQKSPFY